MLMESVLQAARPYLAGRSVRDAVIGVSLIAVELDNGEVGVTYVLREDLGAGCSIFPYGRQVIGQDAMAIATWALSGGDAVQRAIGLAVLCAASRSQELTDCQTAERPFGVAVHAGDTVGMIGHIPPVVKLFRPRVKQLYVFDKAVSLVDDAKELVMPMTDQARLLPTCDTVVLSGTTMINGSIDGLLSICGNARSIIIIGASTPMFPAAFSGTGVTVLAGSWWKSSHKIKIFQGISLACGISALGAYAIKKTVPVVR